MAAESTSTKDTYPRNSRGQLQGVRAEYRTAWKVATQTYVAGDISAVFQAVAKIAKKKSQNVYKEIKS